MAILRAAYPKGSHPSSRLIEARRKRFAMTRAHTPVGNKSTAGMFARKARTGRASLPKAKRARFEYSDKRGKIGIGHGSTIGPGLKKIFGDLLADVGA